MEGIVPNKLLILILMTFSLASFGKVKYCDDKEIVDSFIASKSNLAELVACAKETEQTNLGFTKNKELLFVLDEGIDDKILYFSFPMIHQIDFFHFQSGEYISKKSYSKINNEGDEYIYFDNMGQKNNVILAFVKTQNSIQLPHLLFGSRDEFQDFLKERWIFDGLWFGVVFFALVITMAFFFIRKKKEIIYYSMHILSLFVIQMAFSGYLFSSFSFIPDYFLHRAVVFACGWLTFGTVGLIHNTFIQQRKDDKFIKAYGWIMALAIIHFVACIFFYNKTIIMFTSYLTLVLSVTSILICFYALARRLKYSFSFLLSFSLFLFSSLAFTLKDLGVMNINEIQANYLVKMSLLVEIFILGAVMVRTLFEEAKIITNASMHQMITKGNIKIIKKLQHDLDSPMTSLEYFFSEAQKYLPEEIRYTGRQPFNRIQDIVRALKVNEEESILEENATKETVAIYPLLKRIVSEKRYEFRNRNDVHIALEPTGYKDYFVSIRRSDFNRAISNIINNSIEAKRVDADIYIVIHTKVIDGKVEIIISDNGKGIPKSSLKKVFDYGMSVNKDKGSGIGLSQAKEYIQSESGEIFIDSCLDQGTTLRISLKEMKAPNWYLEEIALSNESVVVVDDDDSIHNVWKEKLSKLGFKTIHFKNVNDFEGWIKDKDKNEYSFLFDLELIGSEINGLDLISSHQLQDKSILVTSHFMDKNVQLNCNRLGVKMIPKESVINLTVKRADKTIAKDIVLIDDDKFTHMNWKRSARQSGVNLHSFNSISEFLENATHFEADIPIYIDSDLGDGKRGEVLSEDIFKLGFNELYLATGSSPEDINVPYWIKDVKGKSFSVIH